MFGLESLHSTFMFNCTIPKVTHLSDLELSIVLQNSSIVLLTSLPLILKHQENFTDEGPGAYHYENE